MAKQRGLTLLEMLVSILILTLVLSLVSSAYSYYIAGFNRQYSRLATTFAQLKRAFMWQDQLSAATEYYLQTSPQQYRVYFDGKVNSIGWITSIDLARTGDQAVAWLGIEQGQLSYCEMPLKQHLPINAVSTPEALCEYRKHIIMAADELKIRYFGWANQQSRQNAILEPLPGQLPEQPQWFEHYNGVQTNTLPLWLTLEVSTEGRRLQYWVQIETVDMQKLAVFGTENHG